MLKTKEERLAAFINNNPKHPFSKQFIWDKKKLSQILEGSDSGIQFLNDGIETESAHKKKVRIKKKMTKAEKIQLIREAKRRKREENRIKRITPMVAYYVDGHTLEETGKKFKLTRERIRQILKRAKENGLDFEIRGIPKREGVHQMRTCPCGKNFEVFIPKEKENNRKTCSRECRMKYRIDDRYKYRTVEEAQKAVREQIKQRYHNNPVFRAKFKIAQKRYHDRVKHTAEYKRKQKIYSQRWRERSMQDPVKREKFRLQSSIRAKAEAARIRKMKVEDPAAYRAYREQDKKRYQRYFTKLRSDPVRYAAYLEKNREKGRERYRKYYQKRKNKK